LITHSAALVPFEEPSDLQRIVRVTPGPAGSQVRRPEHCEVLTRDQFRQLQFMEPAEVRSLLFARASVLCEGETEAGAFPRWWGNAYPPGQQGQATANVPFVSVGGHNGFGRYIRFLDTYAIPWAIVADGPDAPRFGAVHVHPQARPLAQIARACQQGRLPAMG
jgi:predicted ATP-dependent endonuclease of OLD family